MRHEANGRTAGSNLVCLRRIAIGEEPQIGTVIGLDGGQGRAVSGNIQPVQAVVGEVVRETVGFAGGIGNGVELAAAGGSALANGYEQGVAVGEPGRLADIFVSRVEQASRAVIRRDCIEALPVVWFVQGVSD